MGLCHFHNLGIGDHQYPKVPGQYFLTPSLLHLTWKKITPLQKLKMLKQQPLHDQHSMENWQFWGYKSDNEQKIFSKICSQPIISWFALWPLFFMKRYCDSQLQCVPLGSVHKYFGAGAGQNGGGPKSFELPEGGDQKVFLSKGGGVKKVWSNWKYNENQNAQFVAKINRI